MGLRGPFVLVVDLVTAAPSRSVVVTHNGQRYQVARRDGLDGPGTVTELWPGRGVIGSYRRWLGHRYAARLIWYAAINPTGQPGAALARTDELASRRAAIRWLLANTDPSTTE